MLTSLRVSFKAISQPLTRYEERFSFLCQIASGEKENDVSVSDFLSGRKYLIEQPRHLLSAPQVGCSTTDAEEKKQRNGYGRRIFGMLQTIRESRCAHIPTR